MQAALAVTLPESKPSLGRQWVLAHVGAQVVFLAAASVAYLVATSIGAKDPAAGEALKRVALGLTIAADLTFALAFAWMRGAVLRVAVPNFPMNLWLIVVAGYMGAFFVLSSVFGTTPAAPVQTTITPALMMGGLVATLIAGLVLGTVFGMVEALVIRRAAQGALLWVVWMAVAFSVAISVAYTISVVTLQTLGESVLTNALLIAAMKVVAGLILALLTLPALNALKPRHQEAR